MRITLIAAAFAWFAGVAGAGEEIARGKLVEKVVCQTDANQSYALYLPSNYSPDKSWPVIAIFDPGARGRNGVERLQAAAERYGYVLLGSNNSRNNVPWETEQAIFYALMADASSRFQLDPRRVYTAGLSGGARVALFFAMRGNIRGVIACSAGLPTGGEFPPQTKFTFYATTGKADINYSEMRMLDREADDRRITHRLEVFDGGHEWAPPEVMMRALEWFELQAMQAGLRSRDDDLVRSLLASRIAAVPGGPPLSTWIATRDIAGDFRGLADVGAQAERARALAATEEVRTAISADRAAVNRELELIEEFDDAARHGAVGRVKTLAADLRKAAAGTADSPDRFQAQRVLAVVAADMREIFSTALAARDYAAAELVATSLVGYEPSARNHYNLARAQAFGGKNRLALASLKLAVEAGYNTPAQALAEPAFAKMRDDPEFRRLLAAVTPAAAKLP